MGTAKGEGKAKRDAKCKVEATALANGGRRTPSAMRRTCSRSLSSLRSSPPTTGASLSQNIDRQCEAYLFWKSFSVGSIFRALQHSPFLSTKKVVCMVSLAAADSMMLDRFRRFRCGCWLVFFSMEVTEILWDFSIWVESCTILPQLIMIQANTEVRQPACAAAVNCHALPVSPE